MTTTRRRVARKVHPACGGYCPSIKPGDVYLEHVAFPGDDAMDGLTRPWRLRECAACATRYGREALLRPRLATFRTHLEDATRQVHMLEVAVRDADGELPAGSRTYYRIESQVARNRVTIWTREVRKLEGRARAMGLKP